MVKDPSTRLRQVVQKIEEQKSERSRLEGRRDELKTQLKELGCNSLDEAKTEIERLRKEKEAIGSQLETHLATMEATYGIQS